MKNLLLCLLQIIISLSCEAQIHLKGYKCKFYKDQWPFTMAEMCSKTDTFRFTLFSRDIMSMFPAGGKPSTPEMELKAGLDLCFSHGHHKTKDSLYISTRKNDCNVYYYLIYDPYWQSSVSVRSANNDSLFSERSRWLLSQVRLYRHKEGIFLLNEKGQSCQCPNDPEH